MPRKKATADSAKVALTGVEGSGVVKPDPAPQPVTMHVGTLEIPADTDWGETVKSNPFDHEWTQIADGLFVMNIKRDISGFVCLIKGRDGAVTVVNGRYDTVAKQFRSK